MKMLVICKICNKEFEGYIRRYPPKYCSGKCAYKGYILEQKERRNKEKKKRRMSWLVKNQQFSFEILLDKCWICDSIENLVNHHVKYYPVIRKTLCRSCHEFLHKSLLRKKRCKPIFIREED